MGCHFCHEELFAILMVVPFLRGFRVWLRGLYHRVFGGPKCGDARHTCHDHVDLEFTGPPGIEIQPGDKVIAPNGQPFKVAEVTSIGPDGREVVQAVEVKVGRA